MKMVYRKILLRSTIARLIDDEENGKAPDVAKCVNVLDAIRFVSTVMKEVRSETVTKCFVKAGICVSPDSGYDSDDDKPLSELREILRAASERISVDELMTVEEYTRYDEHVPVKELLDDGWENRLIRETNEPDVTDNSDEKCDDERDDSEEIKEEELIKTTRTPLSGYGS